MKIVIIANGYPTKQEPQFGCFEKDQALALKKAGHDVSILYVDGRFRFYWRKLGITHLKDNGINVYGIFLFPLIFLSKLSFKLSHKVRNYMLERVFKYMLKKEDKPDIIYAHYLYNIANAINIKEKYGIPLVGIEHWSMLNQPQLTSNIFYLGNIAYKKADRILAVSNALAKSIQSHFCINAIVVNDMVGEEFVRGCLSSPMNVSRFRFIAIGSLIPRKGFDLLINAFYKSELFKKNCELIVIGGGTEQKKLQYLIDMYSLTDSIRLIGRKNKQEIISYLKQSHVFVLSSHVETFGVVCIEALALGLPVVATICGGPEEFINDKNGLLVQINNVDEMSSAMLKMYQNYSSYDRSSIAKECRDKFSPTVIINQLTSIFKEII